MLVGSGVSLQTIHRNTTAEQQHGSRRIRHKLFVARTIRRQTIRCMDNPLHEQFVAHIINSYE